MRGRGRLGLAALAAELVDDLDAAAAAAMAAAETEAEPAVAAAAGWLDAREWGALTGPSSSTLCSPLAIRRTRSSSGE